MSTIFEEIIKGNLPCDKVFENDRILAFKDIHPQAPEHVLIVPKKPIANLAAAEREDAELLGEMLIVAKTIANDLGIGDNFRLVTNTGSNAGQVIFHLHFHLIGGRSLTGKLG